MLRFTTRSFGVFAIALVLKGSLLAQEPMTGPRGKER